MEQHSFPRPLCFHGPALAHFNIQVSGSTGAITVLQRRNSDPFDLFATIPTKSARISCFIPDVKRLYLVVLHRGNQG
jgi:hypothetical protein